jgi:hypothetical protein
LAAPRGIVRNAREWTSDDEFQTVKEIDVFLMISINPGTSSVLASNAPQVVSGDVLAKA